MAAPSTSTLTSPLDGAEIDPTAGSVLFQWTEATVPADPDPDPPGGFLPSDIADLQFWLDAGENVYSDVAGTTPASLDGTPVANWTDRGSNGYVFAQPNEATTGMPVLAKGAIGGQDALRFDGVDDVLSHLLTSPIVTDCTMFVVCQTDSPKQTGVNGIFSSAADPNAARTFQFSLSSDNWMVHARNNNGGGNVPVTIAPATTDPVILVARIDARGLATWLGTAAGGTSPNTHPNAGAFDRFRVGANRPGSAFFGGRIAEMILYFRALEDAERVQVTEYLGTKYGIDVAAPDL